MITRREYDAGVVIFLENEIGETAYVIEEGRVEVLKKLDGKNVHIAYVGAGEPFGEMSMIDEKPRSATVVAVEKTTVREFHRDDFLPILQSRPEIAVSLLKVIFERLREADATILRLHHFHPELVPQFPQNRSRVVTPLMTISLEGLTLQAARVLPAVPFEITKFPFRIGRRCSDPLVTNDLSIVDSPPWQVSRHHLAFVTEGGRLGVSDRGSRLGSWVNGTKLGGDGGHAETLFFAGEEAQIVLGEQLSPFRFRLRIKGCLPVGSSSLAREQSLQTQF